MNKILSTLESARSVALIFSSLGAHARFRAEELPGPWFVSALTPLGHAAPAVRQALYRLEQKGELLSRREGPRKLYRLSPLGQAAVDASYRKMTAPAETHWDGQWSLVTFQFGAADRARRDQLRWVLSLEGFAALGRGVYVHPRERFEQVLEAVTALEAVDQVHCFRGHRLDGEPDRALVERLWDLEEMSRRYRVFIETFAPLRRRGTLGRDPQKAFALRLALALRYSTVAWDDPELPDALLPRRWAGHRARSLCMTLYERLLPGTLQYGDDLLTALAGAG